MRARTCFAALLLTGVCLAGCTAGANRLFDHLGLEPPGDEPVVFAPGLVSTSLYERDITFALDGAEIYFTIAFERQSSVLIIESGQQPKIASFSGHFDDAEPFVAPNGNRLYFVSNRPTVGQGKKDFDIWFVERTAGGWSQAQNAGRNINTDANEYYPTLTRSGHLYLTARYERGHGGDDIYRAKRSCAGFTQPENLGPPINTAADEYNAFIAPDESWIVFGRNGRLWVSRRQPNDTWTEPQDMSSALGLRGNAAMSPALSPDGELLFFTSKGDIYWVSADVLTRFR